MFGLYVDYSSSAMEHICAVWLVYLFRGIYQQCNVCVPVLVNALLIAVSSYEVYIYTDKIFSYLQMKLVVYVAFEGHICC